VSKGQVAKREDVLAAFGTEDQTEVCKIVGDVVCICDESELVDPGEGRFTSVGQRARTSTRVDREGGGDENC
jgi:hypothetical protein